MPSISVLSGFTFHNWGPLTTTWTPPASCQSVQNDNLYIAKTSAPTVDLGSVSCGVSADPWGCYPTGTITITDLPTATSWFQDPHKNHFYQQYYSPGLYCPSGWGPVATASRNGTKTVEWNGAFNPAVPSPSSVYFAYANVVNNVFLQVLDPRETAVLCCPKSMTPAPNGVYCYSTVPDYTPTSVCNEMMPTADADALPVTKSIWWYGKTVEAVLGAPITADAVISETRTTHFKASDVSSLLAVTAVRPITLMHQPTDVSTSNPAVRLSPRPSNWNGIGTVVGITAAGMFLGAAMILPW
ncbi:hypothetical protein N7474_004939 [Penicillium riverlandense]|uniref:uncharacterized protein n=1 Tax=Penicillium riverlandense TaxID=1903569 RepID=UPI002547F3F7|nr:uncharacterized protein N7474_004939 [Penicillium riverlandense]KAJ5819348.1 hypothetical protein N7474_004939 [Penicillium riverlandense]